MVDPFSITECMFVCESSSGEGRSYCVVFVYVIFYLEVNKDFTDCKQCLLPLLWSCLHSNVSYIIQYRWR